MKLRDGHVSNSSSSSFFLVTTKKNYEKCLKKASKYVQAVAKELAEKASLNGEEMITFATYSNQGNGTFSDMDVEAEPEDDVNGEKMSPYGAWYFFREMLMLDKKSVIAVSVGD